MSANPLQRLSELGQSVWLDYIERRFVRGGALARMIERDAVCGVTSNPAIFHKAIAKGQGYDDDIDLMAHEGLAAHEIHEALIVEDVRAVADALDEVYWRTRARDGCVSLEVSPLLAHYEEETFWEANRLAALVDRRNLMIKVPATGSGVRAIRRLIASGVNVNATLLFTVERYAAVLDAYCAGLEERLAAGEALGCVNAVASFFVSRIDTLIDRRVRAHADPQTRALAGECAIALAKLAYQHDQTQQRSRRWRALADQGARPLRLLWASTGTKDAAYSDVKYIEALIAPGTVTTMPLETLDAYRDHGAPQVRLSERAEAQESDPALVLHGLERIGLTMEGLGSELEADGVRKFVEPHEATLAALRQRIARVRTPT